MAAGSVTCLQRTEPGGGHLGRSAVTLVQGGEPGENGLTVDERGPHERRDEVPVLFPEGAELGLGADDDHLVPAYDLAYGADRVLKLVASHQRASRSAACRSSWGSSPPMGDTSRISMESRSRPVRTRCRPSTSSCPMSDCHRSRLRLCGWPVTLPRSSWRLRSMTGRHSSKLAGVRRMESRQWSRQDRRSERVSSGTTGRQVTSRR